MKVAKPGYRIGDIGHAVESFVISNGFSVVKEYTGHGVGAELHEEPEIPNYGRAGRGARLYPGMTLAIEPMVNAGTDKVKVRRDGWTVTTADGKLSAHYENSIAITDSDPIILTKIELD
jgi:methionyl aminopeptidase